MYRFFFGISGIFVGACLGFLVAGALGLELLYGLHLFLGGIVGAIAGCSLGVIYGNQIGAKIEDILGERGIILLFLLVFFFALCCLLWLISESA